MKIDLSTVDGRARLTEELSKISEYEHSEGRPLVSSIAIYKQTNDHGKGFYKLCQDLGIGDAKDLEERLFGFEEMERCKQYWQVPSHVNSFLRVDSSHLLPENAPPFFTRNELDFFRVWSNKVYDSGNSDHFEVKEYLLNTVWSKTVFWAEQVVNRLNGFDIKKRRSWSKRGWENGKRVSTFKPYTWSRIFRKGHHNFDIFFTVGVQAEGDEIVFKLDYFHEVGSKLSEEQKLLCDKYIPKEIRWIGKSIDSLSAYKWSTLIDETVKFINSNIHHYDQLVDLVWRNQTPESVFQNALTKHEFPSDGLINPPIYDPSFDEVDIDYEKQNKENKKRGNAGEELVKEYEYNYLKEIGLKEYADKVQIQKDGIGYDVLSYDESGSKKYIEVKTTSGGKNTPFYFSRREYAFMERHKGEYFIYRLYNFDEELERADFFIIDSHQHMLHFQPINYVVHLKKKA